jgi:hypothetical protein
MVLRVAEAAGEGGVPTCMYLLGAMGTALVVVTTALVKAVTIAWKERDLRVAYSESVVAKLEKEREARDVTRAMRDHDKKGGAP